ncbi:MAG: hypothetical protein ACSW77_02995, partial [Bacteroidales bacterium]
MKGLLRITMFTLLFVLSTTSYAQNGLIKEVINYRDTLQMELFVNGNAKVEGKRPIFVYTHGGGWNSNDWHVDPAIGVWTDMLQEGMIVVSLHYRQGMMMARAEGKLKGVPVIANDAKGTFDGEVISPLIKESIRMEVEDMYDAFRFLFDNADRWNIDTDRFIIGGGSAGAIGSLMAEYLLINKDELALRHLPKDFHIAGVVAAAGAIWLDSGQQLRWQVNPCPMMFFHGSGDKTVFSGDLHINALDSHLVGPDVIFPLLKEQQVASWYYVGEGYDHVMAALPFEAYGTDIMSFIHRVVYNNEQIAIKILEEDFNGPRNLVDYYTKLLGLSKEEFLKRVN